MYDWDNFDSLIKYLIKYWQAQVVESDDKIYSRRSVLRANNVPISLYFDDLLENGVAYGSRQRARQCLIGPKAATSASVA